MRTNRKGRGRSWLVALGGGALLVLAACQPVKPPVEPPVEEPAPAPTGLSISPTEHDFGDDTADGASGNFLLFTVTNHGPGTTGRLDSTSLGGNASQFDAVHPSAPGAPDGPCPGAVLAPGETCFQQAFFHPNATGSFRTTLVVLGDPGGIATAVLTGNGIP